MKKKGTIRMLYRMMNKAKRKCSILGFGCMRLPQTPDFHIDEPNAAEMVRYAIDRGVNYLDTAYTYHCGESESFLGRALVGGYRDKVSIATKLPASSVAVRKDMDRILDEQLRRLCTDHIDFYLLHGLNRASWQHLDGLDVTGFLDRAIADGRIGHAGFSFHDRIDVFKEIAGAYDWTLCQVQYNYMDEHNEAGTEGIEYAAKRGLGIVIMEPLRGGLLARESAESTKAWASSGISRTPAEWAFRWLWNRPEITVVLSGMSTFVQVKDNLKYANHGKANSLTKEELAAYEPVKEMYRSRMKVPCTRCGYCIPCPGGIDIPECFSLYNDAFMYRDTSGAGDRYASLAEHRRDASSCQDCGVCESLCPQQLPIRKHLRDVAALFGH